jgi:uncharacterized protein (DUF1684 family)
MRTDADSPIPAAKKDVLLPLKYFPPDPSFVAPAVLRVGQERPVFEMPTSTGTIRRNELVGVLEFTLQGQPMRTRRCKMNSPRQHCSRKSR